MPLRPSAVEYGPTRSSVSRLKTGIATHQNSRIRCVERHHLVSTINNTDDGRMTFREPLRNVALEARDVGPADEINIVLRERSENCLIPCRIDLLVVVDEADEIAGGGGDAGVESRRSSLAFFKKIRDAAVRRSAKSVMTAFVSSVELLSTAMIRTSRPGGMRALSRLPSAFGSSVLRLYVGITTSSCMSS